MKLAHLLEGVEVRKVSAALDLDIMNVTSDSRLVEKGALFVAIPGLLKDGAVFIESAIDRGAGAIVAEREIAPRGATMVEVTDARAALAQIAATFHGSPARELSIIGVTGTSGKTTTTRMIESILDATGEPVGLIGTIEYRAGNQREIADRTTPDALVLHEWFARMRSEGVRHAVMEVSSHALALKRTFGIEFAVAVFTNLSRDHFDFHKDFDDYFAAKSILFAQIDRRRRSAVINVDDEWGRKLAGTMGEAALTFGRSEDADVRPAAGLKVDTKGLRGTVHTPFGEVRVVSELIGIPNLYNWLGAIGAAATVGIPIPAIEKGIARLASVRGRFERVPHEGGPTVIVDYAHKPDALEKLLHAVRELSPGREITLVFGCGGERDQGKRPMMGEIAARLANRTIITSDNPRGENPEAILEQIVEGARRVPGARYSVQADRRRAIEQAIGEADATSIIVIAGKGHENYQVIGDRIVHFDDREEAGAALRGRQKRRTEKQS